LGKLCPRFDDDEARRLLAEVIWWRDNAHRIPWIPPAGDGSRYDRMIDFIDPNPLKMNDYIRMSSPIFSTTWKLTKNARFRRRLFVRIEN